MSLVNKENPDREKLDQILVKVRAGVLPNKAIQSVGTLAWFHSLEPKNRARVPSAYLELRAQREQTEKLRTTAAKRNKAI